MPTYEYRCDSCDKTFDVVQSFHDDPLETCPTCGSPVRKVFGSVGIVFKGSGFYKTDSRSGSSSSVPPSSSSTTSTSESSTTPAAPSSPAPSTPAAPAAAPSSGSDSSSS